MKRTYKFPKEELTVNGCENVIFTNHYGGYFANIPRSSYNGWCLLDSKNWKLNKTIESITPLESGSQKETHNLLYGVKRKFEKGSDILFTYNNSLFYDASAIEGKIRLTLDHRNVYNSSELGREYKIEQKENNVVITFTNKDGEKSFLSIKGIDKVNQINSWREVRYEDDAKRNTPSVFWVFDAIEFNAKSYVVFSHGKTEADAITRSDIAFFHFDEILNFKHSSVMDGLPSFTHAQNDDERGAAISSLWSLESLTNSFTFNHRQMLGIYAGLPWFFQIWSRDELISLGGYLAISEYEVNLIHLKATTLYNQTENHFLHLVKNILNRHVNNIFPNGTLKNRFPATTLGSIDSLGWLGKRINDFIKILTERKALFKILSDDDWNIWFNNLYEGLESAKNKYGKQGLFANASQETWMDTVYHDDGRPGYAIEVQALFVSLHDALISLAKIVNSDKINLLIKNRKELLLKIKKAFTNPNYSGLLYDRLYLSDIHTSSKSTAEEISEIELDNLIKDKKVRPNVFLTAYLAQDLLSKKDWEKVFDYHLENLFESWGGITTLAKSDGLFQPTYTGQDDKSYHRGDSWFFVNNITAIVLQRINEKKYKNYINKILEASTKDILENGFAGHASELSSAELQDSNGTGCQAWSSSTYLELIEELYKEI